MLPFLNVHIAASPPYAISLNNTPTCADNINDSSTALLYEILLKVRE
jgi:hypothetical protein